MGSEYGLELVIPDGFIEKLQKADEELEYTAMQAEETKERVIKSFKEMGDQGVDYFLKKLKDMDKMLNGISSKNLSLKGLEQSTKGAARAADDVVKIAESFGQVSQEAPKVDEGVKNVDMAMERMMNDIKQTSQELRLYDEFLQKGLVSLDEYGEGTARTAERLDALMRGYTALAETKEAYKEAENADDMVSMRKQNELERLNETYRSGTSELQKQANEEDRLAKVAQEQAKWEEKQNKDRLNYEKEYVGWFDKAVAKQEKINRLKEEEKRKTYEGAINFSQNATSIAQETQAIKYLTVARDNLSKTDADYQKKLNILNNTIEKHQRSILKAKGETQQFEKQERSLINTSDQLRRKLGLLFSVSAIEGYMKKMVEVRGEFELQKVALTAILQNKEKADQLWAQTQELALKSPFRLQQLVTFTKQLAAYQVQAESLYDTTKRLADVSAGLGVDMGRLILAYGQVKAANYLRSAEIRQFTEAGINMLGELSKLYTELEGKMVSVGEVQSRVQKRMVSFGDVEEVFKRLTDAGGMFYNMQEKQSETLKGMIAKLSDALDIMLNQIGEANQGILKGFVNATLQILQSWEKIGQVVTPIISTLIIRMLALKAASLFGSKPTLFKGMIDGLKLVAAQLKLTTYSLQGMKAMVISSASVFGGWVTILSAVAIAVWEVVKAVQAHNKEQNELNKVAIESTYDAHKLTARYETLVGIIKDQTKSFQEQKAAIDELKRTYGDILPAEMLEIENIRTMGGEYDKARQAIYSYIEARAKQKQIEVIEANEGSDFQKEQAKLISRLLKSLQGLNVPAQRFEITNIINQVFDAQRRGMIETLEDAQKMIVDLVEQTYELSWAQEDLVKAGLNLADEDNWYMGDITYILDRTLKAGTAYNKAIEQISNQSVSVLDASQRKLEEARKKFEQEYAYIPEAFQSTQYWDKMTEAQKDRTLYILRNFYQEMGEEMPDWSTLFNDPLRFDEETRRFNQMWLDAQILDVARHYDAVEEITDSTTQVLQATWDKFTQDVQQKIDTQNLERWQNAVKGAIIDFAKAHEYSLDGMQAIVLKAGQTTDDYFKGIEEQVNTLKQEISWEESKKQNLPAYGWTAADETALERMREMLAIYEYIMSLYPDAQKADKEGDKADREALNLLKERVQLIQEMNKEYEKNKEYLSEEAAWEKVIESYEKHFNELFAGTGIRLKKAILNSDAIEAAIEVGREAGEGLTDAMKEQLEKIAESGEIIRKYSEEGIMQLLQDEGKTNQAVNIGDNKWTIGVGFTEGVKKGDYMSDEEIIERFQSELEKHQKWLNDVLDGYQELYLTQEQYDSLFNLTYQGGKGAAEQLLRRAFDESQAIEYFAKVDRQAQKTLGKSLNSMIAEFNKTEEYDWVENFKGLDNVYDKISELLKIMNLTVKKGQISAQLIGGMGSRSARRSASFAGGKELSQWVTGMIEWGRDVDFTSLQGVYETLSKIPVDVGYKLREEALRFMEGTKAKVGVEIDLDTSKLNLKDLKTQVEELFDGIDIFQDLVKIGFTEEEVRRIFGIEITNTEQLRRRLEEMKDEFVGTKGIDDYNAFMKKIDEIEDNQNVERLKRYEKYLKTMMSETAEIRIQALNEIQDVMKMQGHTAEEKTAIVEGINREAEKKIQEQQWKQFQESDDYQLLFSDIEHLSVSTATRLKDVLDNLRTSLNELTPHQLRQIQAQYEKLDEQIIKHNPFEAVRESMQAVKGLASETDLNNIMLSLSQQKEGYQSQIDDLDMIISMKEKGMKFDALDAKTLDRVSSLLNLSNDELSVRRMMQEAFLEGIMEEMGFTEEQINKYKRLRKAMSEAEKTWEGVMSETKSTLSDIKGAYEAMNDGTQSITLEMVDAAITLADAAHNAVTLYNQMVTLEKEGPAIGAALNSALGIIGLIATAVQTVINVINMIASAHDESLEEEIKVYENRVNRLADAYDRLAEKIQKAYSFAMLATSTNQGLTNLQEQVVAYESMIEAERDKKDSDNERIQEWADKVEELRAKMEETKNEAVREAGGLGGEYKDAAQSFVDAWMQAFRETGNGLEALDQHFEDFLWDIAGKQVLLRAADKFFEPLFEELDTRMTADTSYYDDKIKDLLYKKNKAEESLANYTNISKSQYDSLLDKKGFEENKQKLIDWIENYDAQIKETEKAREQAIQSALELDDEDFEALKAQYEASGKSFDEFAKKWLESRGLKGGEEGDTLSGLQRGIEGITEATAEIIEAYLNSVRFFVSDSNEKITEMLNRFRDDSGNQNPMLNELRKQTSLLDKMHTILTRITVDAGGTRGLVVKIQQ